ncbi:MAG: lipopolysaccharide core heptose(II) kinase RfaY [Fulvivirga sp.]
MNVSKRHYKGEDWRVLGLDKNSGFFIIVNEEKYTIKKVLKEHHRSMVYHVSINGREYILKIPVEKNNGWWIRFTTLFRSGEAFKNIQGMMKYHELGLPTTKPVMAAEKREYGMVIDSWLLYEYLDGEPCLEKEEYYPMVVATLKQIHAKGYLHGDPQIRNFLYKDDGIYVIDSNPKPAGLFNFAKAYEFAYLRKSAPGIENYFGKIKDWWLYRLAYYYDIYERRFVRTRRKLKNIILPSH